jgi:cell division protein FtsX
MTPSPWDGKERRHDGRDADLNRELIEFMARMDQRNMDKDIQEAAQAEVVSDHETRISDLEKFKGGLVWVFNAVVVLCGVAGTVYAGFTFLVQAIAQQVPHR